MILLHVLKTFPFCFMNLGADSESFQRGEGVKVNILIKLLVFHVLKLA